MLLQPALCTYLMSARSICSSPHPALILGSLACLSLLRVSARSRRCFSRVLSQKCVRRVWDGYYSKRPTGRGSISTLSRPPEFNNPTGESQLLCNVHLWNLEFLGSPPMKDKQTPDSDPSTGLRTIRLQLSGNVICLPTAGKLFFLCILEFTSQPELSLPVPYTLCLVSQAPLMPSTAPSLHTQTAEGQLIPFP